MRLKNEMSELSEFVNVMKKINELTIEAVTWKQKALDLEKERDYLRGLLEKHLEKKNENPNPTQGSGDRTAGSGAGAERTSSKSELSATVKRI